MISSDTPPKEPSRVPINYMFVDYENVNVDGLGLLEPSRFRIVIFHGEHQKNLPIFVTDAQNKGLKVEPIEVVGRTREALDLHIAFYLGRVVSNGQALDADYLYIVSKDKGFDPLLRHLGDRWYLAKRIDSISDHPLIRSATAKTVKERVIIALENLQARGGNNRPARVKTLSGTIASLFSPPIPAKDVEAIIQALQKRKLIEIEGTKVSYALPSPPVP